MQPSSGVRYKKLQYKNLLNIIKKCFMKKIFYPFKIKNILWTINLFKNQI
jgi:hypothetical protein